MHENLRVIFNHWRSYSDSTGWLIEEDREVINIAYINVEGAKLFSAKLTRTENPSDSADVTCTLYYWGQTWNAIFACQEKEMLERLGGHHFKTLINLFTYELHQYEVQDSTCAPRVGDAMVAYKRDSSSARHSTWLRSDDISPPSLSRRVQPDLEVNNRIFSRIKRIF